MDRTAAMDFQTGSEKPLPPTPPSNPIVAMGRKVKSKLSTSDNEPSVRLVRTNTREPGVPLNDISSNTLRPPPTQEDASGIGNGVTTVRSRAGSTVRSIFSRKEKSPEDVESYDEYDQSTVDLMDVMDPEVATLSTLTNVQNSLFVPQLGKYVNRRATYRVNDSPSEARTIDKLRAKLKIMAGMKEGDEKSGSKSNPLSNAQYAILPDGEMLEGWTKENKEELDDMVRHQLHSRRAKFKRSMKGFKQYVRRPFGLFITVYATLITLFGAAWVFFLIGWISLGSKEDYVVNVVDNVLVALFAIIGDGLAPFRAVDTYHMIYIMHYHRKTWKKREKLGLPELVDRNDLPDQRMEETAQKPQVDLESLVARRMPRGLARRVTPMIPKGMGQRWVSRNNVNDDPAFEYSVLTPEQQAKLDHHERKFSKSHTFYKPHETATHFAFPLKLLVAVVLLLDLHSCLQITLGACTWGIDYHTRPFALTTVILCFSITCNIMGGVLISMGDKKTRKKEVIERMMRQELTSEAIESMEKRWFKEAEERGEIDPAVRKRIQEEKEAPENEEIKKSWKQVPLLPKHLLGKGEDHRQPSLPQEARRSGSNVNVAATAGSAKEQKVKRKSVPMPSVQEGVAQSSMSQPPLKREDPLKEGTGQKVMRFIRRADFDKS